MSYFLISGRYDGNVDEVGPDVIFSNLFLFGLGEELWPLILPPPLLLPVISFCDFFFFVIKCLGQFTWTSLRIFLSHFFSIYPSLHSLHIFLGVTHGSETILVRLHFEARSSLQSKSGAHTFFVVKTSLHTCLFFPGQSVFSLILL